MSRLSFKGRRPTSKRQRRALIPHTSKRSDPIAALLRLAHHYVFFGVPGGVLHLAGDSGNEEQRPHSSYEHDAADDKLADSRELARKSHGKSAGAVGAHDFEEDLEERCPVFVESDATWNFRVEECEGCKGYHDDGDDENSHSFIDGGFRNGAAHDLRLFAAKQTVESEEADDCRRGDFDTATAATGVRSYEHDDGKEEKRARAKPGNVNGVEAGRTARKSHEERGLHLVEET